MVKKKLGRPRAFPRTRLSQKTYRLHPKTIELLTQEANKRGISSARLLDALAKEHLPNLKSV